jgi:hypothetical protein
MMTTRNRFLSVAGLLAFAFAASPGAAAAQSAAPPAGGAALDEVLIATAGAVVVTTALLVLGIGHRSGKLGALGWGAAIGRRLTGLPGWASLPIGLATGSLLLAVFGMYWDISLHIDQGRDEGPLANAAHYFILAGLFGIFSAGFIAMVLPLDRPSRTAIRITRRWHAPLGGVLICACGAFSLLGFPLDDMWHRIFGQDVTLWGPTHLMLIGGASMTLIGIAVLFVEGSRAAAAEGRPLREPSWVRRARLIALTGGFLLGLSTFQGEFDFGVPQFRLVFAPMLVMLAAGGALVAARLWLGRGAALGAVAFFLAIRGLLALLIGPVLGESTPYFPLYVVEALAVELVALRIVRDRPLAFGLATGVAIGTFGLAAEWGWSHLFMPIPWPAELLPEGALLGFSMAIAGAVIGAWIGARLSADSIPRTRLLRVGGAVAAIAVAGMIGFATYKPADDGVSARVALEQIEGGPDRTVSATVTFSPRDAAADAEWLTMTAWQGGGLIVDRLEPIGPGTYRTTEPIPVHGDWKSTIRLHAGNSLTGVPVYLPDDPAIPAEEVPAPPTFTREFVADHEILQREQQPAAPAVTAIAYGIVLAIAVGLLVLLAWGLHRLALAAPGGHGPEHTGRPETRPKPRRRRAPTTATATR